MGSNYFLNNANRMIGETARYARNFQANGQTTSGSSQTNAANSDALSQLMDSLNPVLLLMIFQMMSQMSTQGGYGLPIGNYAPTLPNTGGTAPPPAPTQNPAYNALKDWFSSGNTSFDPVNVEDNTSIQARLDKIFSNRSQLVQDLAYTLKSLSPDSPEAAQTQTRITQLLTQEGGNQKVIQELNLLWQAQKANHQIPLLEIQAVGAPSEALSAQIIALKQTRTELAQAWQTLQNDTPKTSTEALVAQIKADLINSVYTEAQLGSCLKYLLDQAPTSSVEKIAGLISDLMENGTLNIAPFLYNDYLERMQPERRVILLHAVENSGLRLGSGKPNSRFIGFILENLSKPGNAQTKAFIRQFLKDFYRVHGQNQDTPVGLLLAQILSLGGIEIDDKGQLVFPG